MKTVKRLGCLSVCVSTATPLSVVSCSTKKDDYISTSYKTIFTSLDKTRLMKESELTPLSYSEYANEEIKINSDRTYQDLDGFGFALTEGAAASLKLLDKKNLNEVLTNLFSEKGANLSTIRIPIGASDLSTGKASDRYTYAMTPGDISLDDFSLDGPDLEVMIPILKKIVAIKPSIKIMASPWTAPIWMKNNDSYTGGYLKYDMYETYANYFVKYINAMKKMDINIWSITVQNEPLNEHNNPSMLMDADDQFTFIDKFLGPAFKKNNISTKIIGYDHNADNIEYARTISKSNYLDGSAFHLYTDGENIEKLSILHNETKKNIYFTEQWWGSKTKVTSKNPASPDWGDLMWHSKNVLIGSLKNWSKTVIEWTLATLQYSPDYPVDAARNSVGAVSINKDDDGKFKVYYNPSYYMMGVISKYSAFGMRRIYSANGEMPSVVFKLSDDSRVMLYLNETSKAREVSILDGKNKFTVNVPGNTVGTIKW